MSSLLLIALISLSTYRVTRFVIEDHLSQPVVGKLRTWFETRWEAKNGRNHSDVWASKVAYLLSCYWCFGLWVSAAATFVAWLIVDVPYPILTALTASTVTGLLGKVE